MTMFRPGILPTRLHKGNGYFSAEWRRLDNLRYANIFFVQSAGMFSRRRPRPCGFDGAPFPERSRRISPLDLTKSYVDNQ